MLHRFLRFGAVDDAVAQRQRLHLWAGNAPTQVGLQNGVVDGRKVALVP